MIIIMGLIDRSFEVIQTDNDDDDDDDNNNEISHTQLTTHGTS